MIYRLLLIYYNKLGLELKLYLWKVMSSDKPMKMKTEGFISKI